MKALQCGEEVVAERNHHRDHFIVMEREEIEQDLLATNDETGTAVLETESRGEREEMQRWTQFREQMKRINGEIDARRLKTIDEKMMTEEEMTGSVVEAIAIVSVNHHEMMKIVTLHLVRRLAFACNDVIVLHMIKHHVTERLVDLLHLDLETVSERESDLMGMLDRVALVAERRGDLRKRSEVNGVEAVEVDLQGVQLRIVKAVVVDGVVTVLDQEETEKDRMIVLLIFALVDPALQRLLLLLLVTLLMMIVIVLMTLPNPLMTLNPLKLLPRLLPSQSVTAMTRHLDLTDLHHRMDLDLSDPLLPPPLPHSRRHRNVFHALVVTVIVPPIVVSV